ncbi:LolA family protein [Specibacter sp. RAF43]|uniref:LolA family protein n=1 Tax=Specibacter sp. RAF43 TaxID=3233057 RepID=UPI003F954672
MTVRWRHWMPAAAIPAVIAAGVLAGPLQATAPVALPAKTPAQLVALLAGSHVRALSGTLKQSSELGLPQLPDTGPAGGPDSASGIASLVGLLTAPHTLRIYLDGPNKQRVQVLDTLAERDLVHQGGILWSYDSATNAATRLTLPAKGLPPAGAPESPEPQLGLPDAALPNSALPDAALPDAAALTPERLAAGLLKGLDSSTQVSVGPNTTVAGRTAYELVLTPRTPATLVGDVAIAVDARTGLALRVRVAARGQDKPAFELGFTELSLQAPPARLFNFTPPPGATVTDKALPSAGPWAGKLPGHMPAHGRDLLPAPHAGTRPVPAVTLHGTGWATILATPAGSVPAELADSPELGQLLRPVPGGRALSTSLFTALVTSDGRLLVGAVPLSALSALAASAAGQ